MTSEARSFTGEIRNLQKKSEFIYEVEIWLLNDITNRNGWRYTDLQGNKDQFVGTPILIAYTNEGRNIGDGHNFEWSIDPATGEHRPSFTGAESERIVGALSDNAADIRIVERDDINWVVGKGFLWRWYAMELVDKIEQDALQGRSMSISIETLVTDYHLDEDGTEIEDEYIILGTTILGDGVMPAVADARVVALQDMQEQFNELKVRAASYIEKDNGSGAEPEVDEPAEPEPEPQTNTVQKGLNRVSVFDKSQLADLTERFDGYTVLAACQESDVINVCLMAADGSVAAYTMGSADETIMPEKITKVNAQVVVTFGEEQSVIFDACELTGQMAEELAVAKSELEVANNSLKENASAMNAMREVENKRRVQAAKEKAAATLAAFNANRVDKVAESVLESVNSDIEAGVYTNSVDADGLWVGEEAVENAVLAACAKADIEVQKAKNNGFVWTSTNKGVVADDGSLAAMLNKLSVRSAE